MQIQWKRGKMYFYVYVSVLESLFFKRCLPKFSPLAWFEFSHVRSLLRNQYHTREKIQTMSRDFFWEGISQKTTIQRQRLLALENTFFDWNVQSSRGISLKVFRVDRILEGAVSVRENKNSFKPGSHISGGISLNV